MPRPDWSTRVAEASPGWLLLDANWAAIEPERGRYDAALLARLRKVLPIARKRGVEPVVVVHAGGLPDWVIARGGWLDPDTRAGFVCLAETLGRELGELLRYWVALRAPLAEAALYGADARTAARALIDAQAAAHVLLGKGAGYGGRSPQVGLAERFARWTGVGMRGRAEVALRERWGPERLVEVACTGRLAPPFALMGELQDGVPATDFLVVEWEGVRQLPGEVAAGDDDAALTATLRRLARHERPIAVVGGSAAAITAARDAGVYVLAHVPR